MKHYIFAALAAVLIAGELIGLTYTRGASPSTTYRRTSMIEFLPLR